MSLFAWAFGPAGGYWGWVFVMQLAPLTFLRLDQALYTLWLMFGAVVPALLCARLPTNCPPTPGDPSESVVATSTFLWLPFVATVAKRPLWLAAAAASAWGCAFLIVSFWHSR